MLLCRIEIYLFVRLSFMARTIAQTVMERTKHTKEIMSNNASPPLILFIFIGTNKTQLQKITNEVTNKIHPQVFNPVIQSSPLSNQGLSLIVSYTTTADSCFSVLSIWHLYFNQFQSRIRFQFQTRQ